MRKRTMILVVILSLTGLWSCGPQPPTVDIDPQIGRDCLEMHRASLPPGTQFEGIESATEGRLTIRVMTGAELTTVACDLGPDGSIRRGD
jgi:hypothetical protein